MRYRGQFPEPKEDARDRAPVRDPHRARAVGARRACLRHLLAAPAGAHRVPRPGGRRPDRQPDHRRDPLPRGRGSRADISLYINSPGGLAYAGMAIYDVMQHIRPDVSTVCVGMGMSAAAMVLCGGAPGKRLALPSAKIMIHQGSAGTRGAPRDMEIQLREVLSMTRRMAEVIAHHTGRALEQVEKDLDRDYFMTAEEAMDYGLIDDIIVPRRGLAVPWRRRLPDECARRGALLRRSRPRLLGGAHRRVGDGAGGGASGAGSCPHRVKMPMSTTCWAPMLACPWNFSGSVGLPVRDVEGRGSGDSGLGTRREPTADPDRLAPADGGEVRELELPGGDQLGHRGPAASRPSRSAL